MFWRVVEAMLLRALEVKTAICAGIIGIGLR